MVSWGKHEHLERKDALDIMKIKERLKPPTVHLTLLAYSRYKQLLFESLGAIKIKIMALNQIILKSLLKLSYLVMNDRSNVQVNRSTCSRALKSYSWSRHHRYGMAWTDTDPPWSHSGVLNNNRTKEM